MDNRMDAASLLNFSRGIELVVHRVSDPRSLPRVTQAVVSAAPGRARLDALVRKPSHDERLLDMLRPSLPTHLLDAHATMISLTALADALRKASSRSDVHTQIYRRAAAVMIEEIKSRELVSAYKRALYSV